MEPELGAQAIGEQELTHVTQATQFYQNTL